EELRQYGLRSGTIKSLSFEVKGNTTNPTFGYLNFTIYIKCVDTSVHSLSKSTGFMTGMIPVYSNTENAEFLADGVYSFQFNKPYNWDTTKSLIIGICYSGDTGLLGP